MDRLVRVPALSRTAVAAYMKGGVRPIDTGIRISHRRFGEARWRSNTSFNAHSLAVCGVSSAL